MSLLALSIHFLKNYLFRIFVHFKIQSCVLLLWSCEGSVYISDNRSLLDI